MRISKEFSVALDLLRVTAATMVFLQHANRSGRAGDILSWFTWDVGHSAVVIFFVLSGYVIALTTSRERGPVTYGIARFSRIYSVAVPALLLTWAIDVFLVRQGIPLETGAYQLAKPQLYLPLALAFSGDLWTLSEPAMSNGPFWSLNYEVWYYVAFAALFFCSGVTRWIGSAAVFAIMGPKLLLLFPIWLGGVAVQHVHRRVMPPRGWSRVVIALSVAAFILLKAAGIERGLDDWVLGAMGPSLTRSLGFSQWFVGDYVVGVLMMLVVFAAGGAELRLPPTAARLVTALAGLSFSLYVVHYPLLQLFSAFVPQPVGAAPVLALLCALAFGAVFEPQRHTLRRLLTMRLAPAR